MCIFEFGVFGFRRQSTGERIPSECFRTKDDSSDPDRVHLRARWRERERPMQFAWQLIRRCIDCVSGRYDPIKCDGDRTRPSGLFRLEMGGCSLLLVV